MKNVLFLFFGLLLLVGCEKEAVTAITTETDTALDFRSTEDKIDVCHYSEEDDTWQVINISESSWPAHAGHGDVQLIDEDGDGYVTSENECGLPLDCDDTDAGLTDNCSCIEGEIEIDFNGPLFVAPADEPLGVGYNWQEAIAACNAKDTDGCDWYLPSIEELNALYLARETIGGFVVDEDGYGGLANSSYWSSSEDTDYHAWKHIFVLGDTTPDRKHSDYRCRCVRR